MTWKRIQNILIFPACLQNFKVSVVSDQKREPGVAKIRNCAKIWRLVQRGMEECVK